MARNTSEYFAQYYAENKDRISKRRKKLYHTDKEYRKSVLQASRDYREKKRSEKKKTAVKIPRRWVPLEFKVRGGTVRLFSVGFFALYLQRSIQSINYWESAKPHPLLPPTPYRNDQGFRYYTIEMMEVVRDICGDRKRMFPRRKAMYHAIRMRWKELGVPVNKKTLESALKATVIKKTTDQDGGVIIRGSQNKNTRVKVPRYRIPLEYKVQGGTILLFQVGFFALYLQRSIQSINYWEKSKPHPLLPKTPYRDERGFRYYTIEMMEVVKGVCGDRDRMFPSH